MLKGHVAHGVVVFKGIPYAAPPGAWASLEGAATGNALERGAGSAEIRATLHAGTRLQ
jgi:hypothetical protein